MKKDFKYSSIFIINLIVYGTYILTQLLTLRGIYEVYNDLGAGLLEDPTMPSSWWKIIYTILLVLASFAIARGLLINSTGGVGEYLSEVKNINIKAFLLLLVISLIKSFGYAALGGIIGTIVLLVLIIMTAYAPFVVADRGNDLNFGDMVDRIIKISRERSGKTIGIYAKYYLIPAIVLILATTNLLYNGVHIYNEGQIMVYIALMAIFPLAYQIFVGPFVYRDLSMVYMAYKDSPVHRTEFEY